MFSIILAIINTILLLKIIKTRVTNSKVSVKIRLFDENCKVYRSYPDDSGLDLRARLDDEIEIRPYDYVCIPTGIAIELPKGYEGHIRPRSGLSKKGIIGAFGTIDNGYRGEIKVILYNHNNYPLTIKPYERIAQLIVAPVKTPIVIYTQYLNESKRGQKGFGSSGRI